VGRAPAVHRAGAVAPDVGPVSDGVGRNDDVFQAFGFVGPVLVGEGVGLRGESEIFHRSVVGVSGEHEELGHEGGFGNAAVVAESRHEIGRTAPRGDRGQMRRTKGCYLPLGDRVVGLSDQTDLAVRPRLDAGPFDDVVKVVCLSVAEEAVLPVGTSGAVGIGK
jgi:hypothetical protein